MNVLMPPPPEQPAPSATEHPLCKHCEYSLRGLPPDAPCPECGKSADAPVSLTVGRVLKLLKRNIPSISFVIIFVVLELILVDHALMPWSGGLKELIKILAFVPVMYIIIMSFLLRYTFKQSIRATTLAAGACTPISLAGIMFTFYVLLFVV